MRVGLLLQDSRAVSRVYSAKALVRPEKDGLELRPIASWEELARAVMEDEFDLALVQPDFGSPGTSGDVRFFELGRLCTLRDPARFILYACGPSHRSALKEACVQLRFPFLVLQDLDDEPSGLLGVMARAWARWNLSEHLRGLPQLAHPATSEFLAVPLAGWPSVSSVPEYAQRLHLSVRTLYRRQQELNVPTPDRLMRWGQLLQAAGLLQFGVRPLGRVAVLAGRSGASSLRKLSMDLTARDLDEFLEPDSRAELWRVLLEDLVA